MYTSREIVKTLLYLFLISVITSCSTLEPLEPSDTVVGVVDEQPVTLMEVKANYQPASDIDSIDHNELADFLPTYLDFKTKLQAAEDAGYLEDPAIENELQSFAVQSAYSYWLENVVDEHILHEYESRRDTLISVTQLLIRLGQNAPPSDTLRVYNRLEQARQEYISGTPFDTLVNKYASTVNNQKTGGKLGYISAGRTVKPFEDVAYNLKIDSISHPVRTQFGYHLVLVTERKERQPDRELSHIFFRTRGQDVGVDTAMAKAWTAYRSLEDGMPWEKAVKEYTEDQASINKAGRIGWVNYGQYQPSFTDSVFAIDTVGVHTKPTLTNYGVHIFRIDSVRQYDSIEDKRQSYLTDLKKLPRYKNRRSLVHQKVREAENARLIKPTELKFIRFIENSHDTLRITELQMPDSLQNLVHYNIGDSAYTTTDYLNWLKQNKPDEDINYYKNQWLEDYEEHLAKKHLVDASLTRFPDYAVEYSEFKNSLAVFQITQDSVWTYGENDTTALRSFYAEDSTPYRYPERYMFTMFTALNDSTLYKAKEMMQNGTPTDSLQARIEQLAVKTDSISVDFLQDEPYNRLENLQPNSFTEPFKLNSRKKMLYLHRKLPSRQKTFLEAYNEVLSKYQEEREQNWIEHLRERYNVQAYKQKLIDVLTAPGPKSM
mgnify:CR=1 FL=1